jgi:hypothetical protein
MDVVGNVSYIWPVECGLTARLAGLRLGERLADWDRSPFTSDSQSHVRLAPAVVSFAPAAVPQTLPRAALPVSS